MLLFGWGLLVAVAFMRRSTVLVSGGGGRFASFAEENWVVFALGGSLPCLALAVWGATTAPSVERPSPPRSFAAALARGLVLAALLCGALALYLACGGHDVFYYYPWTPVGNAAFLAPLLGMLSILEVTAAERLRAQLGWSLLAAVSGVAALLVAWTQREYANTVFTEGHAEATTQLIKTLEWLTVDPIWTLQYFAWVAAPVGALTFARLRPQGERTLFALAVSGAVLPWFMPWTEFADAAIVTAAGLICVLTSPAFRLGDFLHARAAAKLLGQPQEA